MSAQKKLVELLRRRQGASQVTAGDVLEAKQWEADVDEVMAKIRKWLEKMEAERLVRIKPRRVTLTEEAVGKYSLPALTISTPGYTLVTIEPVGLRVMGARGRIDLVSGPRSMMLLRFGAGDWHFVSPAPSPGHWESEPLQEESFYKNLRWLLE